MNEACAKGQLMAVDKHEIAMALRESVLSAALAADGEPLAADLLLRIRTRIKKALGDLISDEILDLAFPSVSDDPS
jgi:hypothetical protein